MSYASDTTRKQFSEGDTKRDAGLKSPDTIVRFDDIAYGNHGRLNLMDIYRPKNVSLNEKLPVIFNIHGGGWVYGDKEVYQFYGMSMAERGFVFVNPSYRLAPEDSFPAQLEDIELFVKYAVEHADEYGIDVNNMFLVGDSAGGHLGALYCALLTNEKYREKVKQRFNYSMINPDVRFNAIGLNCGAYDIRKGVDESTGVCNTAFLFLDFFGAEPATEDTVLSELINNYPISDEDLKLVCPNFFINEDFPPTYLMSAKKDFLLFQVPIMERELVKNNVQHAVKVYGDEEFGLYHVFHCNMNEPMGKVCNDDEAVFFKKYIK